MVVDASLAVKWLIPEVDSDLAERFFIAQYGVMHAPDLLLVEVGGRLVRGVNERKTDAADAYDGFSELRVRVGAAMTLHRMTPELLEEAPRHAIELGHPIKDCVYLALADQLGCVLATSDVKFRDRVADPARVKLLAELV